MKKKPISFAIGTLVSMATKPSAQFGIISGSSIEEGKLSYTVTSGDGDFTAAHSDLKFMAKPSHQLLREVLNKDQESEESDDGEDEDEDDEEEDDEDEFAVTKPRLVADLTAHKTLELRTKAWSLSKPEHVMDKQTGVESVTYSVYYSDKDYRVGFIAQRITRCPSEPSKETQTFEWMLTGVSPRRQVNSKTSVSLAAAVESLTEAYRKHIAVLLVARNARKEAAAH